MQYLDSSVAAAHEWGLRSPQLKLQHTSALKIQQPLPWDWRCDLCFMWRSFALL